MSIVYFAQGGGFAAMLVVFLALTIAATALVAKSRHRDQTGNVSISAFFIALGLTVLVLSTDLQQSAFAGNEAATIPRLWSYILIPSSLYLIIRAMQGMEEKPEKAGRLDKVAIVLIALLVSVSLMEFIGYFICSGVFIFVSMYALGYKRLFPMLVISTSWVAFAYLIFYRLLFVGLPVGSLMKALFNI